MYQIRKNQNNIAGLILFSLLFLSACATTGKAMSAKQQGLLMETMYKTTYSEVKAIRENPKATFAQVRSADQKEEILKQARPILKDFLAPVNPADPLGDIVGYGMSEEKLKMLFDLIDQLSQLAVKEGAS